MKRATIVHGVPLILLLVATFALAGTGSNLGSYGTNFAPAVLTGQVTKAGQPVAGATVSTIAGQTTTTDAQGTYTLYLDAPGLYTVTASKGADTVTQQTEVALGATTTLDLSMGGGQQYTLTVNKDGTGTGTVTSAPAGIDCGTDCTEAYDAGTTVTLSATFDPDSTFANWSGDCTDIGNDQAQVTMDADKTCTATFMLLPDLVSVPEGQYMRGPLSLLRGKLVVARLRSTNQGGQAAGGFVIEVFLSDDAVLDAGDILKKSMRVPSLAPGQSRVDTILFVDRSAMAGKYLISQIDAADEVPEADEANNLVVEPIP